MERLQEAESGLKTKLQSWPEKHGAEGEAEAEGRARLLWRTMLFEDLPSGHWQILQLVGDMMSSLPLTSSLPQD